MLQPDVLYTESILPIVRASGNNIPIFLLLHGCACMCSRVYAPEEMGDQEVRVQKTFTAPHVRRQNPVARLH